MNNKKIRRSSTIVLDKSLITSVLGCALEKDSVEVGSYRKKKIHEGINKQIYRVYGTYRDREELKPWSVILKTVKVPTDKCDPTKLHYWKRETLVYESDLFKNLRGGLRSQKYFGTFRRGNQAFLFFEEVSDTWSSPWGLKQYATAAKHLAQFNAQRVSENENWKGCKYICTDFLFKWTELVVERLYTLQRHLNQPDLKQVFPGKSFEGILDMAKRRGFFLSRLNRIPHTVCHLDAHKGNLFSQDKGTVKETIAIDWGLTGLGPLGGEIAPLVSLSIFFFHADVSSIETLDAQVFESYLEGLRDFDCLTDPRVIRFGYASVSCLRLITRANFVGHLALDKTLQNYWERRMGHPIQEILMNFAEMLPYHFKLEHEAMQLAETIF